MKNEKLRVMVRPALPIPYATAHQPWFDLLAYIPCGSSPAKGRVKSEE